MREDRGGEGERGEGKKGREERGGERGRTTEEDFSPLSSGIEFLLNHFRTNESNSTIPIPSRRSIEYIINFESIWMIESELIEFRFEEYIGRSDVGVD